MAAFRDPITFIYINKFLKQATRSQPAEIWQVLKLISISTSYDKLYHMDNSILKRGIKWQTYYFILPLKDMTTQCRCTLETWMLDRSLRRSQSSCKTPKLSKLQTPNSPWFYHFSDCVEYWQIWLIWLKHKHPNTNKVINVGPGRLGSVPGASEAPFITQNHNAPCVSTGCQITLKTSSLSIFLSMQKHTKSNVSDIDS